jgi:hypothetical protein
VSVQQVDAVALDGPAHHGLIVQMASIIDPNLTVFEVHLREDVPQPTTWTVYSTSLKPFDGNSIVIPFRNGIHSLQAGTKYCVRIRALYGDTVSNWATICGITVAGGSTGGGDPDGDGISNDKEYAMGLDPNNADTDGDGTNDGTEVANGTDPSKYFFSTLEILTPILDFGNGEISGAFPNQHQNLILRNKGEQPVTISKIEVVGASVPGTESAFKVAPFPKVLSHIPPQNVAHIPISFLPKWRGALSAKVKISSTGPTQPEPATVKGMGVNIPDCTVSPSTLNFGSVPVNDQAVNVRYVTIANTSLAGDTSPNINTPFAFTVHSSDDELAPGLRGLALPKDKEFKLPILFRHQTKGNHNGTITIESLSCGQQTISVTADAQ